MSLEPSQVIQMSNGLHAGYEWEIEEGEGENIVFQHILQGRDLI